MKTILLVSALAIVGLSACAKGPDSITPVSMGDAYSTTPCQQAVVSLNTERQTLSALEAKQRSAVVGDAVGVFLLAVPVSSLTGGNVEGQVATSKGKVLALEARARQCGAIPH